MASTGTHDELRDLAPLYVIGALPPAEAEAFARHLAACAECAAEVESLRPVTDLLASAVPQHTPPPHLRQRVLAIAQARHDAPADGSEVTSARVLVARQSPNLLPWLLAAASLAITAGLGVYTWQLRGRLDTLTADLRTAIETAANLQLQLTTVRQTAGRAQLVAAVISAPDLARIDLVGQPAAPAAAARAFWSDSRDTLVFNASNLPPLTPGRTYQVWVLPPAGAPISAGLIQPDAQGRAEAVVNTAPGMPAPAGVAVSEEPAQGSPSPSTTPFLVGTVARAL